MYTFPHEEEGAINLKKIIKNGMCPCGGADLRDEDRGLLQPEYIV